MPWRCSSPMMRPSVQVRLCFGLSAFAVDLAAGSVVVAGAEVVVFVVGAAGAAVETTGGRSRYFGASMTGAASLTCVVAEVVVICGAEACSLAAASDRLRGPAAWAEAETRTMAATRMILRI